MRHIYPYSTGIREDKAQHFSYKNVDTYGAEAIIDLKLVNPEDFLWVRKGNLNSNFFYHLQYSQYHAKV